MEIRHLDSPDDVREVVRVHNQAWREAYADILPADFLRRQTREPTDERVERAFDRLRSERDRFLVAVADDRIRGYAHFQWEDTREFVGTDEAELREIYVEPDYWGQRLGTALLERGLDLVPGDATALKLQLLAGNEVGRRFYEARGFERVCDSDHEVDGETFETEIYALSL